MSAKPFITAIIAAAGSSSRMNGINKLLFEVDGITVIARTIDKFNSNDNINEIVISARSSDIETIKEERQTARYNELINEATEKLNDAQKEFDEEMRRLSKQRPNSGNSGKEL